MNLTEAATQITLVLLEKSAGHDTNTRTAYVIKTYKEVHQALVDAERQSPSSGAPMAPR